MFKLFTAMALAAMALLSRSMLHLNHPRDTVINVRRLMEAAKNWEADLAGGIVPDYPHPPSFDSLSNAAVFVLCFSFHSQRLSAASIRVASAPVYN
eukprot:jgi/Tetstr1/434906/TSEL_023903.t1